MRKDTILIVLGFAVVAAATYFILEVTLERAEPQLASVTPDEPPVVEQEKAAKSDKAKELATAGLSPEEKARMEQKLAEETSADQGGDATDSDTTDADSNDAASPADEDSGDANADETSSDSGAASGDAGSNAESGGASSSTGTQTIPANVTYQQDKATSEGEAEDDDAEGDSTQADTADSEQASTQSQSAGGDTTSNAAETADEQNAQGPDSSANPDTSAAEPAPKKFSGEPAKKGDEIIAKDVVNIRAKGTTDSAVVGQLQPGDIVIVTADAQDAWAAIKHEASEKEGWVYLPLFRYAIPAPE